MIRLSTLPYFRRFDWLLGNLVLVAVFLPMFTGCAAGPPMDKITLGTDSAVELKILKDEIEDARKHDVQLLSPAWYKQANASYHSADNLRKRGGRTQAVLEKTAQGRAQLKQAQQFTKRARVELKGAIEARAHAITADVPALYANQFDKVERRFLSLAEEIERGDVAGAGKGVDNVVSSYWQLETRAVKDHTLGETRRLISEGIKSGARKSAPKTLASAQAALQATEQFITKHPRASQEIQKRAGEALHRSQHLHVVMRQVDALSKQAAEDRILALEKQIIAIEKLAAGKGGAVRVQTLQQHLHSIEESIKALQDSQGFLNAEIARLQLQMRESTKRVLTLGEEKQKREAERKFAEKIERVRRLYTRSEAEVYRQGDYFLIRLKGMNFEVGKSYIIPEHFPLLTKVQKSIRIFDTKRVVIEGHTDSTGTRAMNERLSRNRAAAVMAYLVNNDAMAKDRISAVGYGPEKPIAPNTSPNGRRQNRRIDVVLTVK